ncbi:hypothetical protein SDC9_201243 [bioreactor metagenome]|uniref:Bacterial surface antigen (D15) domain-containing protein n=1 Tax=bioreactor metagenome TaxID=1076179 RepID=A0A645IT54_9ZZZZ
MNLGANLFKDSTLYKVRFLWNKEFDLLGSNDPSEEFYSAGVMIGKVRSNQYIQFRYSGGIGVIGGVKRGDKLLYTTGSWLKKNYYGEENFITPSIPLELDLIFKPIKHFGIGFAIWGELNYKRPMGGIIFKIEVGKLR